MAQTFREHNPDQPYLFPPSPVDWLPDDHKAFFVRDVVNQLDLFEFFAAYSKDGRGAPAYSPALLLSIVLYGWMSNVYSCRKLAQLCRDDIGARYLVGENLPDFRSLNRFRLRHHSAIEKLFLQSVRLCQKAGMVTLTDTAVDGTRLASYSSSRRNIQYGRIAAEEARHLAFLRDANARADAEDAADDARFGPDNEAEPVPEELKTSEGRRRRLREAKAAMEAEAKAQAETKLEEWEKSPPSERPHKKKPDPETAAPSETAQYNPVDPQSRLQYSCQSGFLQGYNGQIAVDAVSEVIVASDLSSSPTDVGFLVPILDQTIGNTGIVPGRVLADGGYYSEPNITAVNERGAAALIPPPLKKSERAKLKSAAKPVPELTLKSVKLQMLQTMAEPQSRIAYLARRSVERTFGQIKGSPGSWGFRRFTRLTLDKCRLDWMLICTVHNFRKYMAWNIA